MIYQAFRGASTQQLKLDGSNYIDLFPNIDSEPIGGSSPDQGTITIQGVTFPTSLWAEGELKGYKFEIDHRCKVGALAGLYDPHIRFFPVNDNAGTVVFTFDYFFFHIDNTTSAGGTCTMTGTVLAGDKTANRGVYIACDLDPTNARGGSQIIGVLTRTAGTYVGDVALQEFGIHAPVGQMGFMMPAS